MVTPIIVTPLTPPEAVDFIIGWEVTSRSVYEKRYAKPTWPGGESGATIGVGYDLAHHDADDLALDWPTLSPAARSTLATACGKSGQAAKALIPSLASVTVPWDAAYQCFRDRSLPKYERQTADAFGGRLDLPPLCFGALVSLVYNRGAGMAGDSRAEMRAIRDLIAAGKLDEAPDQFRSMKRLWPTVEGLRNRREAEAVMWERGLSA
ncbi:glycoside hydrolase family protein [Azospirillum melinis]|uniref:glycoside hydrolase family protein n=1 Tax=Azospirillum melinis TaxID=328839 RepID=UPI00375757B3